MPYARRGKGLGAPVATRTRLSMGPLRAKRSSDGRAQVRTLVREARVLLKMTKALVYNIFRAFSSAALCPGSLHVS